MSSTSRFGYSPSGLSADAIRRFLAEHPHSPLAEIVASVCPGFATLSSAERILVWHEMRSVLKRMEEAGVVCCKTQLSNNLWYLSDYAHLRDQNTRESSLS